MSTILDALRKAKDTPPPRESVDAQREILSGQSHDYLATVPISTDDSMRKMWLVIGGLGLLVLVLAITLIGVLLAGGGDPEPTSNQTVATMQTPQPTPPSLTPSPTPQPTPAPTQAAPPPAVVHVHLPSLMQTPVPSPTPQATPMVTPVPTAPPTPTPMPTDEMLESFRTLKLQGILWDPQAPMALINGKDFSVGDSIGKGLKVIRIDQKSVILEGGGREFTLQ